MLGDIFGALFGGSARDASQAQVMALRDAQASVERARREAQQALAPRFEEASGIRRAGQQEAMDLMTDAMRGQAAVTEEGGREAQRQLFRGMRQANTALLGGDINYGELVSRPTANFDLGSFQSPDVSQVLGGDQSASSSVTMPQYQQWYENWGANGQNPVGGQNTGGNYNGDGTQQPAEGGGSIYRGQYDIFENTGGINLDNLSAADRQFLLDMAAANAGGNVYYGSNWVDENGMDVGDWRGPPTSGGQPNFDAGNPSQGGGYTISQAAPPPPKTSTTKKLYSEKGYNFNAPSKFSIDPGGTGFGIKEGESVSQWASRMKGEGKYVNPDMYYEIFGELGAW